MRSSRPLADAAACALMLSLAAPPALSTSRLPGEYLNTVRPERIEPQAHPFAPNFAKGPLKVLFLVPMRTAPREVAELASCFSMDLETILYSGPP